jgi:hypothetical protein
MTIKRRKKHVNVRSVMNSVQDPDNLKKQLTSSAIFGVDTVVIPYSHLAYLSSIYLDETSKLLYTSNLSLGNQLVAIKVSLCLYLIIIGYVCTFNGLTPLTTHGNLGNIDQTPCLLYASHNSVGVLRFSTALTPTNQPSTFATNKTINDIAYSAGPSTYR